MNIDEMLDNCESFMSPVSSCECLSLQKSLEGRQVTDKITKLKSVRKSTNQLTIGNYLDLWI